MRRQSVSRAQIAQGVVRDLAQGVAARCEADVPQKWLWHGLQVQKIDGTTFTMEDMKPAVPFATDTVLTIPARPRADALRLAKMSRRNLRGGRSQPLRVEDEEAQLGE